MTIKFDAKQLKIFHGWISEREHIRKLKEAGYPRPWTEDPILMNYRFCNVRRMDDKVSRWLLKHWYHPRAGGDTLLTMAALARLINWPDTLEYTGLGRREVLRWNPIRLKRILHEWEKDHKVFTGAYIINGARGGSKIDQVVDNVHEIATTDNYPVSYNSMEETWRNLLEYPGMGSFIAGQVVADLRFTKAMKPKDKMTWAPLGPGSKRGIRKLLGKDPDGRMKQSEFNILLPALVEKTYSTLPEICKERKLEAMDIQNCLCEYDKYTRLLNKEGNVKNKYPGAQRELDL